MAQSRILMTLHRLWRRSFEGQYLDSHYHYMEIISMLRLKFICTGSWMPHLNLIDFYVPELTTSLDIQRTAKVV